MLEVCLDVFDVFVADGDAHSGGLDAGGCLLLGVELLVGG